MSGDRMGDTRFGMISKKTTQFFILFFMADHCLWLINSAKQNFVNEICWIFILIFLIAQFGISGFKEIRNKRKYYFCYIVLFTVFMGIYSTIQSYILHGQSVIQGAAPPRFMISGFLMYFVLMKYIQEKEYALDMVKRMFLFLGYLELVLYIAQYLLLDHVRFLQISYSNIRLGDIRMNLGSIAVPFVVFYSINNIYINRKSSWKDAVSIVAGFFYAFVIAKTRIVLAAYIIALIGGYMIWKRGGKRKIIVFIALILFVVFLSQTKLFSYLMDGLNNLDMSSQTRQEGRMFYLARIKEHPIWGCGYINTNHPGAVAYSGMNNTESGIYWVDLGIYGLTFFFGGIGFFWFILLYSKMTRMAFCIARKGDLTFWMYMIYSIVICPNGTGFLWYISNTLELIMWMCLIESEYKGTLQKQLKGRENG